MKTNVTRGWMLGAMAASAILVMGCGPRIALSDAVLTSSTATLTASSSSSADIPADTTPANRPTQTNAAAATAPQTSPQPKTTIEGPLTEAPGQVVQAPEIPQEIVQSEALREVVRLLQAGISEQVILAYVTNSTNIFSLSTDAIIYLNDLGASPDLITALIERSASPDMEKLKKQAQAVKPLPEELKLKTPAKNVYPGENVFAEGQAQQAAPQTGESGSSSQLPPSYQESAPVTEYVEVQQPQQPVTVNYFYNYLAPYGSWIQIEGYGLCWRPTVAVINSAWRPYLYGGRWLWTDYGWYWYSDYTWGAIPFHYGRWFLHGTYGWCWWPDTVWGPSWVTWRYTPSYCGWAPLPPAVGYSTGVGFTYFDGSLGVSVGFGFGPSYYTFVPFTHFYGRHLHHHVLPYDRARHVYKDSTVINNYVIGDNNVIINRGIEVDKVARFARQEIPKTTVREVKAAARLARLERLEGDGRSVVVARPEIPKASRGLKTSGGAAAAPLSAKAAPPRGVTVPRTPSSAAKPMTGSRTGLRPAAAPSRLGGLPGPVVTPQVRTESSKRQPLSTARQRSAAPQPEARPAPPISNLSRGELAKPTTPGSSLKNTKPAPSGSRVVPGSPSGRSTRAGSPRASVQWAPPAEKPSAVRAAPSVSSRAEPAPKPKSEMREARGTQRVPVIVPRPPTALTPRPSVTPPSNQPKVAPSIQQPQNKVIIIPRSSSSGSSSRWPGAPSSVWRSPSPATPVVPRSITPSGSSSRSPVIIQRSSPSPPVRSVPSPRFVTPQRSYTPPISRSAPVPRYSPPVRQIVPRTPAPVISRSPSIGTRPSVPTPVPSTRSAPTPPRR